MQLKEIPSCSTLELKSKAMDLLIYAHGLRHENINPLIGNFHLKFHIYYFINTALN